MRVTGKAQRTLMVATLLLLLAQPVAADIIGELDLVSRYMWRGFDQLEGRPALQPSLVWAGTSGLFAVAGWSVAAADRDAYLPSQFTTVRQMDEMDLIVGHEWTAGRTLLQAGLFSLHWIGRSGWPDRTSTLYEAFAAAAVPGWPGEPALQLNVELDPRGGHDLYLEARGGHSFFLDQTRSLYAGLHAGLHSAEWIGAEGFAGFSDATATLELTQAAGPLLISPHLHLTLSGDEAIKAEPWTLWGGLRLTAIWSSGGL